MANAFPQRAINQLRRANDDFCRVARLCNSNGGTADEPANEDAANVVFAMLTLVAVMEEITSPWVVWESAA